MCLDLEEDEREDDEDLDDDEEDDDDDVEEEEDDELDDDELRECEFKFSLRLLVYFFLICRILAVSTGCALNGKPDGGGGNMTSISSGGI